jgi:hypothetical protein
MWFILVYFLFIHCHPNFSIFYLSSINHQPLRLAPFLSDASQILCLLSLRFQPHSWAFFSLSEPLFSTLNLALYSEDRGSIFLQIIVTYLGNYTVCLIRTYNLNIRIHNLNIRTHNLNIRTHNLNIRIHNLNIRTHNLNIRTHNLNIRTKSQKLQMEGSLCLVDKFL